MATGVWLTTLAIGAITAAVAAAAWRRGGRQMHVQVLAGASATWLLATGGVIPGTTSWIDRDAGPAAHAAAAFWIPLAAASLLLLPPDTERPRKRAHVIADLAVTVTATAFILFLVGSDRGGFSPSGGVGHRLLALVNPFGGSLVAALGLAWIPRCRRSLYAVAMWMTAGFALMAIGVIISQQPSGDRTSSAGIWAGLAMTLGIAGVLVSLFLRSHPATGAVIARVNPYLPYFPVVAVLPIGIGRVALGEPIALGEGIPASLMVLALLGRQALLARELTSLVKRHQYNATHDALTGLANRTALVERVAEVAAMQPPVDAALLLADLDGFKEINDNFGHDQGDLVLCGFGAELAATDDPEMMAARLGGDEFAVFCVGTDATARLMPLATHFGSWRRVSGSHEASVQVLASVGVATMQPGDQPVDLLRRADQAMYEAKRLRMLPRVRVYSPELGARAERRSRVSNDVASAARMRELRLVFQPIVRLSDGEIVAAEALLRWQHPRFGTIAPGEFIALAEESGDIVALGTWVLEQAVHQLATWDQEGHRLERLFINTSVQQYTPELPQRLAELLDKHHIQPSRIALEVTEHQAPDLESVESAFSLRGAGIHLALDGFGAGFSSFAQLSRLPVDVVKIDSDFAADLGTRTGQRIVESIVALASALELDTVVEGVETESQAIAARSAGVAFAQGYLFARPVSPGSLGELLDKHRLPLPRRDRDEPTWIRRLRPPG